jgi:heme/copper-type cytochrome/quinol oxidase subunit 2
METTMTTEKTRGIYDVRNALIASLVVIILVETIMLAWISIVITAEKEKEFANKQMPELAKNVDTNRIIVPEPGATGQSPSVAIPVSVVVARSQTNEKLRTFEATIANNVFSPSTFIVSRGDTVKLNITAKDGRYDFSQPEYGFNAVELPKGIQKTISFDAASEGQFIIFCTHCGGPQKGPIAHLVVTQ